MVSFVKNNAINRIIVYVVCSQYIFRDTRKSEEKLTNCEDTDIRQWNLIPGATSLLVIVVNCCCTDLLDFVINWIIGHLYFTLHSTPLINCK